jgi:hypothetical protein
MSPNEGVNLHVVPEWYVGPKADKPAVILILRHIAFEKVAPGSETSETAVLLTPDQARALAADLLQCASLFPSHPTTMAN